MKEKTNLTLKNLIIILIIIAIILIIGIGIGSDTCKTQKKECDVIGKEALDYYDVTVKPCLDNIKENKSIYFGDCLNKYNTYLNKSRDFFLCFS